MPNPFSWYFHRLPKPLHRLEVAANHATQLAVPFALFAPQPVADVAGVCIVVTQGWLMLSGNFSWLNALTMVLAFSAFDDDLLHHLLPVGHPAAGSPGWFQVVVLLVAAVILGLSYWPARNLISKGQRMNASFNPLHLVNTYGAFGSITRTREEIVVEGTNAGELNGDTVWVEYEFKGKPTDPRRRPPQVAPYHLRLDWLMWFAALSPGYADGWFGPFLVRLLENDGPTLRLLKRNPFPDHPPTYVRARLFRYRFTSRAERRETGAWWHRTFIGDYVRPLGAADMTGRRRGSMTG